MNLKKGLNIIKVIFDMLCKRSRCGSLPFIIKIDPCTYCNLHCISCPTRNYKKKQSLKLQDIKRIVAQIKNGALRVSLYGAGEPLLNKEIYSIIQCASEAKISTVMGTNLTLFKESDLKQLWKSKLTVLQPCLDGYTQETYGKYRVGGDVETVKLNIVNIAKYKRKKKSQFPFLDVQVILFDHIKDELAKIQKFCTDAGVDKITYIRERYGFQEHHYKVQGFQRRTCFWLYVGMRIDPAGDILPCCNKNPHNFSYGNILKKSLVDIWNNEYYKFSRSLFRKGPDLPYNHRMEKIPCLVCKVFPPKRGMKPKKRNV